MKTPEGVRVALWRLGHWLCARFGESLVPLEAIAVFKGGAVSAVDLDAPPGQKLKDMYFGGPGAVEKAFQFLTVVERENEAGEFSRGPKPPWHGQRDKYEHFEVVTVKEGEAIVPRRDGL